MAVRTARHLADLVGAEEVGAPESGEDREEPLGLAELLLEEVEGVRERVAHRDAEGAQTEALREHAAW